LSRPFAIAARQQAEEVILDVGATEAAKLKAARDREAALAKQEAELIAAGKAGSHKAKRADATPSKKKKK
jgi:hypothetical protein